MNQNNETSTRGKIYHVICFALFLTFFIYDRLVSNFSFFTNLLFLTFIAFHLNWAYYVISLLIDFGIIKNLTKDNLDRFFNFVFAMGFTSGIMFWAMYFKDPNSVLQKGESIPIFLNLFIHGGVFIVALLEQIFFNPRKSNRHVNILFLIIFITFYTLLLKTIFYFTAYAIYPFVKEYLLGFAITCLTATLICLVGHYIYKVLSYTKHKVLLEEELKEKDTTKV